jgi:DNA-binding response OmpR family regulator
VNERILIIDDDAVVRQVARASLERDGYIVHCAGETVLQEVRRRSEVPILVLSAKGRMEERVKGLGLGADDYLPKPFSSLELVARVKALLRRAGGGGSARDLLAFDDGRLQIDTVRHEVRVAGELCDVTRSEYDLLLVLTQYPGRVYTREEIAYRLRGHDFDGDERVVDVHVRNLRRKVEVDAARPRCIETVRGVGYRLGVEPS